MPVNRGAAAAVPERIRDVKMCPVCSEWIESPHGRRELNAHIKAEHGQEVTP